jgi:hypothetical protein
VIGSTYLLRGVPVVVLARWGFIKGEKRTGPRNVLVEFPDGSRTVRPFRGLRVER